MLNTVQAKSTTPFSDHEPLKVSYSSLGSRDALSADDATGDSKHDTADMDRGFDEIFCPPTTLLGDTGDTDLDDMDPSPDGPDDEDVAVDPSKHDTSDTNRDFDAIFCPPVAAAVDPNEDSSFKSSSSQTFHHEAPHTNSTDDDLPMNLEFPLSFECPVVTDDSLLFNPWLTKDDDDFDFENRLKDFSRTIKVAGSDDTKYPVVSSNLTITPPPKYPPGLPINIRYPKSRAPPRDAKIVSTLQALLDPSDVDDDIDIFNIANFDPSPRQLEDSESDFDAMFHSTPRPQSTPPDVEEDPPPAYSEVKEMIVPPNLEPLIDAKCSVSDRPLPHPRPHHFRSLLSPFPPLFQSVLFRLPIVITNTVDLRASTDLSSDLDDVDDETPRNVSVAVTPSCTSMPSLSGNDAKYLRRTLPLAEIFLHNVNMNQVIAPKLSTPATRLVVFKPP
ncbi:hypothetical protein LshimejAT787_1800140 [Lyophyllum shimeji]|uniref:Uncharacterized protein n=1 Tax=Lyophyllum shimeji TaxID=47721 RepID=A0A9P3PX76_LYOSH|nr:hypothetical protein LshimejAT787_1800140 [Lyophyllum shimeji]